MEQPVSRKYEEGLSDMEKSALVVALEGIRSEMQNMRRDYERLRGDMERGDKTIASEIQELRTQQNGRAKKLEHSVFGCEESGHIGVCERLRRLERNWATLTAGAVLLMTLGIEGLKWAGKAIAMKLGIH